MTCTVFVDDNFHYMDDSERYELGEFLTIAAAIEAARRIVDEHLLAAHRPGMTAEASYQGYTSFGEDPFIVAMPAEDGEILFSAWDYEKRRCDELCAPVRGRENDG